MYWLMGSLIVVAMMGVLAVADSVAMPIGSLLVDNTIAPALPLSLITLAITLLVLAQFNVPSVNSSSISQNSPSYLSCHPNRACRILNHTLVVALAMALVMGSALQAMISHQQAEMTEVTKPMRVQALVTIEGISDSVYDAATDSSYRQVATITYVSPLVSELTTQDLDTLTMSELDKNRSSDSKHRVLLNAYPKKSSNNSQLARLNHLQPGDQLFMSLTLAPLATSEQAINNPSGFDSYRWLRGRHIDGVTNVLATSTPIVSTSSSALAPTSHSYLQSLRTRIDQGRWQLRQHFYQDWAEQTTDAQQAKAVTLSLLTGDRSLINRDTKDLYQLAGISHLLAISGTHILFLAIMLAGAVVLIFNRLCPLVYRYVPRWQVRWWVMIGAAFIYALFTGFDVPAARTAWMLLAIGVVRLTLLPISTMRVLLALAVLMAWQDPYVLWQAGYWLSFIAVALLLKYDDTSYKYAQSTVASHRTKAGNALVKRVWALSKRMFRLQFWLFITLLPITLLLFGKASLWGLVINLFAIGLFGWVIVPLNLLAGLCYLLSPVIADSIWALVIAIVAGLHEWITGLTSMPVLAKAWLYTPINMAILLMVLLSILPWLLPRGLVSRWLALPPLTLLIMTVYANQQSLMTIPTLYILPTGDRYVSAVLLQYPIVNDENASKNNNSQSLATGQTKKNVSWLFLADHRPTTTRTVPSHLTADKLSMSLEQQLGSLSVNKLEGIVVQSARVGLTATLTTDHKRTVSNAAPSELLPMTVAQLNQRLPVSQYWQAGRSDRWPKMQQAYQTGNHSKSLSTSAISAQRCEQGKLWQLATGGLSIEAMTGWSKIGDANVWDCTVAIDTHLPMRVLIYNAADPMRSLSATAQTLTPSVQSSPHHTQASSSRVVLNADTHQRVWQMWSLLCVAEKTDKETRFDDVIWLGHSASDITADVLRQQRINKIMTYDEKALEVALALNTTVSSK
ncbi:ComEC/Rec2 family competence protein [Psychrobacter namhaensis]|uniref:ComEC/Rec2 family competence protein n=1 Tax=Psychrobacter namhaensis TaxID=292734 RepID=UPI0018DF278D|nr:ComEC/Rec2 family competence protein [Psychrobacter namhaensis]